MGVVVVVELAVKFAFDDIGPSNMGRKFDAFSSHFQKWNGIS